MIRVHIFCEGQTEDVFVRTLLSKHFAPQDIYLNSIIVSTSKGYKGGITSYEKIKRQIEIKCKEDPSAKVTTLIDYYAFPEKDFPMPNLPQGTPSFNKAQEVQKQFQQDINQPNFIAYLSVHEFESLLFSDPSAFEKSFDQHNLTEKLQSIANRYSSPEHINSGPETAPSKRILKICSNYEKALHGPEIAERITLDVIREKCSLFDTWIKKLEQLT